MMERFHVIEDAAAILVHRGVYRQAKVYRRGEALYAGHGAGFVRLYRDGTSVPQLRCGAVEVPGLKVKYDNLGKAMLA